MNTAIVIKSAGDARIEEVSIPRLRDDYVLIKVKAVSVQPTDWKHIDNYADPGARVGCDYAGIVEEVGSRVTKPWKKGQRIAGFCHGSDAYYHEGGAFANFIVAKGDVQFTIPDSLSYEAAATLGAAVSTIGLSFYKTLGLPWPSEKSTSKEPILIYGGSSSVGNLAIQLAKMSGFSIITTFGAHNFDYVKELGADFVFDYKDPDVVQKLRDQSGGKIRYALDCIAEFDSTPITVGAMSKEGGLYDALRRVPEERVLAINDKVQLKMTLGYTVIGEAFRLGALEYDAVPEDFEFQKTFLVLLEELLAKDRLQIHNYSVNEGGEGLEGALIGIQKLRERSVSGRKLVYTL